MILSWRRYCYCWPCSPCPSPFVAELAAADGCDCPLLHYPSCRDCVDLQMEIRISHNALYNPSLPFLPLGAFSAGGAGSTLAASSTST